MLTRLVEALSNLVCASLTEDPYGVAQRDIPKILEAFVRFLSIIKSLSSELEDLASRVRGGADAQSQATKLVEREVGEIEDGEFDRLCARSRFRLAISRSGWRCLRRSWFILD